MGLCKFMASVRFIFVLLNYSLLLHLNQHTGSKYLTTIFTESGANYQDLQLSTKQNEPSMS